MQCLGHADLVYETTLGEEKYTFVEGVAHPHSCTILLKGAHKHQIAQVGLSMLSMMYWLVFMPCGGLLYGLDH